MIQIAANVNSYFQPAPANLPAKKRYLVKAGFELGLKLKTMGPTRRKEVEIIRAEQRGATDTRPTELLWI